MMKSLAFVTLLCIVIETISFVYTPDAIADQITNLPGADNLDFQFNQFSGYLHIPGSNGNSKHMHYWLVESMNNPMTDPLAFWTNGGPGCSGMIGFMTEQGPFKPNKDGGLYLNEYAWNRIANMVFIESPAGVGFSYSLESNDYIIGDQQTAIDNYNLIQSFLIKFPHFSNHSLYITSESYGGHYMPTLAKQIIDENQAGIQPKLNFQGFAVGNPYTNVYSGEAAMFDTFWGHQLVSKPSYDHFVDTCYNTNITDPEVCYRSADALFNEVGDLNPYALDFPVCTSHLPSKHGLAQRIWFHHHLNSYRVNYLHHKLSMMNMDDNKLMQRRLTVDSYEPCTDNYAFQYLNRDDVKEAIHVMKSITWDECSSKVQYNMTDSDVSMAPIYNYLIDGHHNLNILVYSGDDDSICATIGTQDWIWDLGYNVSDTLWTSYIVDDQPAGFLTQWSNTKLGFLTIHGAGHEVPTFRPDVAYDMWTRYLAGEFTSK